MRLGSRKLPFLLFLSFIAMLLCAAEQARPEPLRLGASGLEVAGPHVQFLRGDISFEQALASSDWAPAGDKEPDFGFSNDVFWFRVDLDADQAAPYIFEVAASVTSLKAFLASAQVREFPLDLASRMAGQGIHYRRPATAMDIPAGPSRVLFRMQSSHLFRFPLRIWKPEAFYEFRAREMFIFGIFFGSLAAIALYNLFVYLSTREKSYRTYIFYIVNIILYNFAFEGFHIQLLSGLPVEIVARAPMIVAGPLGFMANTFARGFLQTKTTAPRLDVMHRVMAWLSLTLMIAAVVPPIPYPPAVRAAAAIAAVTVALMFISGLVLWLKGFGPARYYTIAIALFVASSIAYSGRILGLVEHSFLIQHGAQMGILAEVLLFSLALSDRINVLKRSLEENLRQLEAAHDTLAASEKKYRVLVEDTSDLILSLDPGGVILSVNQAALKLLGYTPGKMTGMSIHQFLYRTPDKGSDYEALVFQEALAGLNGTGAQLPARFASRQGEPVDLSVRLEKIHTATDSFIICKASAREDDALVKMFRAEHGSYQIDNFLSLSDMLNHRVTRNLQRYFSADDADAVRLILREMLVNAIEHGNLEITFEEKTKAQEAGTYLELIRDRQKIAPYRDRKVMFEYSVNARRAWFKISDEGKGFDHKAMERSEHERMHDLSSTHGRGIALSRMLFDVVRYNEPGNSVTLVKLAERAQ